MKKSQAAIEFLSTYGWALLSVLVIIGALTYFGIFNTRKMVQDYCSFSQELKCEDYMIHEDGWVEMRVRNNFGKDINVTSFYVSSDEGGSNTCNLGTSEIKINAGSQGLVGCNMNAVAKDNKIKVKGIVTFKRSGSSNIHNVTGELYATVGNNGACNDGLQNCHVSGCNGCETSIDGGAACTAC